MTEFSVSRVLTQKVWDKLNDTAVPIVKNDDFKHLGEIIDDLNSRIKSNQYFPDNVHGYLGVGKKLGVTRFIPIITHIDMALYYQLCGEIGDRVVENIDGVFGGWQVVPTPATRAYIDKLSKDEKVSLLYSQEYFSETFSSAAWFQNYKSFTAYIRKIVNSNNFGNYVGITDVANFYDTIDVEKLISKLKRKEKEIERHLEILDIYLRYWNRRLAGYQRSNKGIPQEIISDGSRNLSHFYLHDFDRKIIRYCDSIGVKFVRWADDMLFFASSRQKIESSLYEASKFLLSDGLNLSAPKTKILTRVQFRKYRCLPLLQAVNDENDKEFLKQIDAIRKMQETGEQVKLDTAIRAAIGHARRKPHLRTNQVLKFIENGLRSNPEIFASLTNKQMLASVVIFKDRALRMDELRKSICKKQVAAPKANFLKLIRDERRALEIFGIEKKQLISIVDEIDQNNLDSEILENFCIKGAKEKLSD
nr:RNA-directed DNA polymerase [uncultured Cohaesibacter sp.]